MNPRKRASIVPHHRPGVRLRPVSCRGYFHAWRESQSHRKQSWQAGQEYMHSCKTLVGYWNPNPGKEPPTAVFFIAPNGAAARPAGRCEHTSFQPVKSLPYSAPARARSRSTCRAFGKAARRPLPGDWGRPPTSGFYRFSPRRKSVKSFRVYHETLLATIENG